jgi:phage shock protein PspC (stress-responsive transcriptional regulator)
MNKTVTCNIAGLVFHIEDHAYEKLLNYLNMVKQRLAKNDDADEIIQDIEARIAELFSNSISNRQEVILEKNVNEIITALGAPEDYILEDDLPHEHTNILSSEPQFGKDKTLMRDKENGVIAGVCAGVAAYIGWDPVVVRVLFLLALLLTGFGFIVYLVLWIAAPVAVSSSDRLRMQGKPINLDTISQEVQEAAGRLENYANGPNARKNIQKIKAKSQEFGSMFRRFFGALMFVGGVLGIIFFIFVGLVENGFFIDYDGESPVSLYYFSSIVFNSHTQAAAGWFAIMALVLLPLLFITISGIFLIFNIRNRALGHIFLAFLGVWIAGAISFGIVSAQIARDFTYRESSEKELFRSSINHIKLEIPKEEVLGAGLKIEDDTDFGALYLNGDQVSYGSVNIEIADSKDSLFHVKSIHYASGISKRKAYARIENIQHLIDLDSNYLRIAPSFYFPLSDKLRYQKVVVRIEVPKFASIEWIGEKKDAYDIDDLRIKEWEE